MTPRPVVKWAGGKRQLVDKLRPWIPSVIDTYAEPFAGGAALFFALAAESPRRFKRAILADKNPELIRCYRVIQKKRTLSLLIKELKGLQEAHFGFDEADREKHYYEIRNNPPTELVARAARFIFLNKTCFNGLWRVNASGKNNVPFGRYAKPTILDRPALDAAHQALDGVEVLEADFSEATKGLAKGDFAYFDPPYVPLSRTANFTAYAKDRFGPEEQARLVKELGRLRRVGVHAMLSNTHSEDTTTLYEDFPHREVVEMARSINSDPSKRGNIGELVVMTYDPKVLQR